MKENNRAIRELDDIQTRITCGIDMVGAVQELMEAGPSTPESCTAALFGAWDYLRMLNKELAETIDRMRAERKVGAA